MDASASIRPLRVLFLCTGNSCRSQMAEGWARNLKGGLIIPFSAGTAPQGVNTLAIAAMREAGVDISKQESKHLDAIPLQDIDWVVTVCDAAQTSCPAVPPNVKVHHISFDDPPRLAAAARTESEALPHYRRVRDEIRAFIETLPEGL